MHMHALEKTSVVYRTHTVALWRAEKTFFPVGQKSFVGKRKLGKDRKKAHLKHTSSPHNRKRIVIQGCLTNPNWFIPHFFWWKNEKMVLKEMIICQIWGGQPSFYRFLVTERIHTTACTSFFVSFHLEMLTVISLHYSLSDSNLLTRKFNQVWPATFLHTNYKRSNTAVVRKGNTNSTWIPCRFTLFLNSSRMNT